MCFGKRTIAALSVFRTSGPIIHLPTNSLSLTMSTFRSLGFFTLSLVFAQSAYAQSSLLQARSSGEQVYKTVCIA